MKKMGRDYCTGNPYEYDDGQPEPVPAPAAPAEYTCPRCGSKIWTHICMKAEPVAGETKYLCPVCGYLMGDEPRNYNICPCCGTEFGLNDAFASHAELRESWLKTGPKFWSDPDKPTNWNPYTQLARLIPQTGADNDIAAPTVAAPAEGKVPLYYCEACDTTNCGCLDVIAEAEKAERASTPPTADPAAQWLKSRGIRDVVLRHEGKTNEQKFSSIMEAYVRHINGRS